MSLNACSLQTQHVEASSVNFRRGHILLSSEKGFRPSWVERVYNLNPHSILTHGLETASASFPQQSSPSWFCKSVFSYSARRNGFRARPIGRPVFETPAQPPYRTTGACAHGPKSIFLVESEVARPNWGDWVKRASQRRTDRRYDLKFGKSRQGRWGCQSHRRPGRRRILPT